MNEGGHPRPLGPHPSSLVDRTCIVVADAATARFFGVERLESSRDTIRLVERITLTNPDLRTLGQSVPGRARTETNTGREAGAAQPMGEQRERHRMELDRRFGDEIALHAAAVTRDWKEGTVVLVAEPRLLGLMRQTLRDALDSGIELKELAKDYVNLTLRELQEHLTPSVLLPSRRKDGPGG